MKVILLNDVYKQGVAGDTVNVAPGYARNYLIPNKLAVKATPGAMRSLENLRQTAEVRRSEQEQKYDKIAASIEGLTLAFPVKASEAGKLYGSVTSAEIADQLKEELGLDIDRRRIGDRPLRELGTFPVVVRLDTGLTPNVTVIVHREDEDPFAQVEVEEEPMAEEVVEVEATAEVEAEEDIEIEVEAEVETEAVEADVEVEADIEEETSEETEE